MVDIASEEPSEAETTEEVKTTVANPKQFACRKCRKVLFNENDLQEHASKVKNFQPRDNKVSKADLVES